MKSAISIKSLSKTFEGGHKALNNVSLEIHEGEILALLGPNGAGKTTLISIICGITVPSSGTIQIGDFDNAQDYRAARKLIGLVPQEITLEPFESVLNTVNFSRGLFGLKPDAAHIEKILRSLTLWDKRNDRIQTLSGGMKRRVLIAKALSHEPRILFLDEPTAGVDVELRKDMWNVVRELAADGVTIILTTHYIEEAEEIADRVGVINAGEILLVETTATLMQQMGKKELRIELQQAITALPESLSKHALELSEDGGSVTYYYDTRGERTGITTLLNDLNTAGMALRDIQTKQSSLEDIFVDLVRQEQ